MHQIVLLTALTATTGLFGGGRCGGTARGCGRPTMGYSACAPTSYGCQPGTPCGTPASYARPAYAAPQAPVAAPQAPVVAPAPAAPAKTAPQAAFYPSYYYPAAAGCAGGNCYRR